MKIYYNKLEVNLKHYFSGEIRLFINYLHNLSSGLRELCAYRSTVRALGINQVPYEVLIQVDRVEREKPLTPCPLD